MLKKEFDLYIDESGDFGKFEKHCPFYLVTMVLHDQSYDISDFVVKFDEHLKHVNEMVLQVPAMKLLRDPVLVSCWMLHLG